MDIIEKTNPFIIISNRFGLWYGHIAVMVFIAIMEILYLSILYGAIAQRAWFWIVLMTLCSAIGILFFWLEHVNYRKSRNDSSSETGGLEE